MKGWVVLNVILRGFVFSLSFFVILGITGCGGGGSSSSAVGAGGAGGGAKGPFKKGSHVVAYKLNADGSRDENRTTLTTDSQGHFSFGTSLPWTGPTEFVMYGEYLNENTGTYMVLSEGKGISAIVNLIAGQSIKANINIFTNIAAKSIKEKMAAGISVSDAKEQAQESVKELFNIPGNADLEELDLTDGSGDNAEANTQLLLVSSALLNTANPEQVLEDLASDLSDGKVDDAGMAALDELKDKVSDVDLAEVAATMEDADIGVTDAPDDAESALSGTLALDNNISFTKTVDALTDTPYISEEVLIDGIYGGTGTISVIGGTYSIDGADFISDSGTISNGQKLRLKTTSSSEYSTEVEVKVTIGGSDFTYKVITKADPYVPDTTPNPFDFGFKKDVNTSSTPESEWVTITGINTPVNVEITSNTSSFTATPSISSNPCFDIIGENNVTCSNSSTIHNGDKIRVKHTSASSFGTQTKTVVTIGGVSGSFSSFTVPEDKTPDAITFASMTDVNVSTEVTSNEVTISGINTPVSISIEGGTYSINGGDFTSETGTIRNGDILKIRQITSSDWETETEAKVTVNNTVAYFKVKTMSNPRIVDATPDEFKFATLVDQNRTTEVQSEAIVVSGINTNVNVSIENGEYSIDGGSSFTSEDGNVSVGQSIVVKQITANEFNKENITTLTIGGVSGTFKTVTVKEDKVPEAFSFTSVENADINTTVESNVVTISGINTEIAISIENGKYKLNDNDFTVDSGTVQNGDRIVLQHVTSSKHETITTTALTVGGVKVYFTSKTLPAVPRIDTAAVSPVTEVYKRVKYVYEPVLDSDLGSASEWIITNKPSWAEFNPITGRLSGIPSKDDIGEYNDINITATNVAGNSNSVLFSIEVKDHPPVANSQTINVVKNTTYRGKLEAIDADTNDVLKYELVSIADVNGDINITNPLTGEFSYTPTTDFEGEGNFTFRVTDENNVTSNEATVSIVVRARVISVTANDDSVVLDEDTNKTIDVLANDESIYIDDNTTAEGTVISNVTNPSSGSAIIVSNHIVYTPNENYYGTDSFEYTITSVTGVSSTATITVTVNSVNDNPVSVNDSAILTGKIGSITIDVLANDTDIDGDTLSVSSVAEPLKGTVSITEDKKKVVYTATGEDSGVFNFTYTVSDGHGGSATATVYVSVDSNTSAAVANASKKIEQLDMEQDAIDTALDDIKKELEAAPSSDKSAQVALALLDIASVLNNSCVNNLLDFNDSLIGVNYSENLPKFIFGMFADVHGDVFDLKTEPQDFTNCTKEILNGATSGLKDASDKLAAVYADDPDFVFVQDDLNLTKSYADAIRATALFAASKINYITAHNFGMRDSILKNITETVTNPYDGTNVTVTYREIDVNPGYEWMSSYYFFAYDHTADGILYYDGDGNLDGYHPDAISLTDSQALLDASKGYLLESASIASSLNPDDFELEDREDINDSKTMALGILDNLVNGHSIYIGDQYNGMTLDLRPIFVANSNTNGNGNGIDAFDIAVNGKFEYDCSYDKNMSKINGYATCTNGTEANVVPREVPKTENTDINEVLLSYTEDGTTYNASDELLMYLFGGFDYIIGGIGWREDFPDARYFGNYAFEDSDDMVNLVAGYKFWDANNTYNNDSRMQIKARSLSTPAQAISSRVITKKFTSEHSRPGAELKAELMNYTYDFGVGTSLRFYGGENRAFIYVCVFEFDGAEECQDFSFDLSETIDENSTYELSISSETNKIVFEVFNSSDTSIGRYELVLSDLNDSVKSFYDDMYNPSHAGDELPSNMVFNKFFLRVRNDDANEDIDGPDAQIGIVDVNITYP